MEVAFFNPRVKKFLKSLEADLKSRIDRNLHLLRDQGPHLKMPYSKPLGRGLFELRIVAATHIRILYTFHGGSIWILHAFAKQTSKIYTRDILYGRTEQKRLLREYNG